MVKDYARIIFGTFMAACGIAIFSNPARLTGGGVTGVGTILYYTLGIDPGVSMLCINIPLFFLGMHFFGSKYGLKVFVGATMLSVWTSVLGGLTGYRGVLDYTDTTNVLISAVCYGVLVGGGIGIVMRAGANTGGTDILAQIVAKFTPFNVGSIEFCMNACVVLCGGFFFGIRNTIFAFIAMYISGQMISYVVVKWGTSLAKTAYIFSNDRVPDIARRVIRELHHGGTLFKGTGIYTSKERNKGAQHAHGGRAEQPAEDPRGDRPRGGPQGLHVHKRGLPGARQRLHPVPRQGGVQQPELTRRLAPGGPLGL